MVWTLPHQSNKSLSKYSQLWKPINQSFIPLPSSVHAALDFLLGTRGWINQPSIGFVWKPLIPGLEVQNEHLDAFRLELT